METIFLCEPIYFLLGITPRLLQNVFVITDNDDVNVISVTSQLLSSPPPWSSPHLPLLSSLPPAFSCLLSSGCSSTAAGCLRSLGWCLSNARGWRCLWYDGSNPSRSNCWHATLPSFPPATALNRDVSSYLIFPHLPLFYLNPPHFISLHIYFQINC